ncbi:hypothetical protein OPV22_009816 [Ensete ventricosum]|uniref:Uncharacterized protein n=1 Tax=Ensete ventricosum TaxID=4639 RepID=A0AAV8RBQ3_ENSVE|nr:hypothetical protein OPV22_009816 [Ensete ventricosum]
MGTKQRSTLPLRVYGDVGPQGREVFDGGDSGDGRFGHEGCGDFVFSGKEKAETRDEADREHQTEPHHLRQEMPKAEELGADVPLPPLARPSPLATTPSASTSLTGEHDGDRDGEEEGGSEKAARIEDPI